MTANQFVIKDAMTLTTGDEAMSRIDHFNGNPLPEAHPNARLPYDFDFRKKGTEVWRYLNSVDEPSKFEAQKATTLAAGGEYLILESRTGKVIEHA